MQETEMRARPGRTLPRREPAGSAARRRQKDVALALAAALTASLVLFLPPAPQAATTADQARLAAMIRTLTAPELAGRGAGTAEERAAAEKVAGWLVEIGLEPAFAGAWLQEFALPDDHAGSTSVNVAGVIAGRGHLADRWLILGAHLDHLGRVDPRTPGIPGPGAYYPGAGDNAAGVAAIVEAARQLVDRGAPDADRDGGTPARRSIMICAFGAEEIGLIGSAHLAAHLPVAEAAVDAMINLDAVGRLGQGPLHVAGLESSAALADLVAAAAGDVVAIAAQAAGLASSDHASFLARGIPALFLFTGGYPEMNSPADSLAAVDLPGTARIADLTARLVATVAAFEGPLAFIAPPTAAPVLIEGDRRTWFGSVPDFAATGTEGYRIGGLADDGPAARAGLRVGDRLLSLAGEPVTDLASFTTALRRHAPGEVVDVTVAREGRTLSFLVTLGDRADRLR